MAEYKVILTNNGLDKLENAMATGESLVLKEMGFGDAFGEEYVPTVTQQDLKHKIFSKQLSEAIVSEGTVRFKTMLLSTDPSGDFLELGLYLDDGSLFAVANIPKLEHRQSDSGAVTETEITIVMVAENAQNVTIEVSSNIYVTKDYANTYYIRTDGQNNVLENISLTNHKITNLAPGTLGTDAASINQLAPVGAIFLIAGPENPSNCIDADGLEYPRVGDKAELYRAIGTLFGGSATTFKVPKLDPPFETYGDTIRWVIKYKQ